MHNTCFTQKWDELKVIIGKCAFQWKEDKQETSWRRELVSFHAETQENKFSDVTVLIIYGSSVYPEIPEWSERLPAEVSPVNWVTPRERISTRSSQISSDQMDMISPEELKRWECFTNTFVTFKSRQHYFYFSFTKVAFVGKKKKIQ